MCTYIGYCGLKTAVAVLISPLRCNRLGLISLAYLWRREQKELLAEMAAAGVEAVLIKVAAMGLTSRHLGQSIAQMYPTLCTMVRVTFYGC
jgi:diphthamide synthase (EF-2-diphthine--ammonia ligase)